MQVSEEAGYAAYAEKIAEVCGAPSGLILSVLELSRDNRMFYHGVKKQGYVGSIIRHGLEPRTPMGGNVTYMTTGLNLFLTRAGDEASTIDTSFFYHGHHEAGMCLFMSDEGSLSKCGIDPGWKDDGQVTIRKTIPPESLSMINVSAPAGGIIGREDRARLERVMLSALESQLKSYSPGKKMFL